MFGLGLLAAEVAAIAYAHFDADRFVLYWAPYDVQTHFQVRVTIGGRELTQKEACKRYRFRNCGRDDKPPQHNIGIIKQYEQTYGQGSGAEVELKYSINGRAEQQVWTWPQR